MSINWKRNQPIVLYLRMWLPQYFPVIHRIGGYNDKTTETGGFSAHSQGRAADIYLRASDLDQRQIGDGLFRIFMAWGAQLGIDHVIWNHQIWSADTDLPGQPRPWPANRDQHTNHIHVAFTADGSQQRPALLLPLLDGLHLELYGRLEGE